MKNDCEHEFQIGDCIVVRDLHYDYKKYSFLKSGMVGMVVDILPTNNVHDWQRLEIMLFDSISENVKLYSGEIDFIGLNINNVEINESVKEKCENMVSKDIIENNKIETSKILECFKNKVLESMDSYFDDLENDIIENDPIQSVMRVAAKYAQDCLEEREIDSVVEVSVHIDNDCGEGNIQSLTKETVEKIDFLTESRNNSISNLQKFIDEISSILCMCDSFEQSVQVLRDYGIIEKKKVKVVSDFDFKVFCESVV